VMAMTGPITLTTLDCDVLRRIATDRVADARRRLAGATSSAVVEGLMTELGETACVLKAAESASVARSEVDRIMRVLERARALAKEAMPGRLNTGHGEAERRLKDIEATMQHLSGGSGE
jgi:hypothetical protein